MLRSVIAAIGVCSALLAGAAAAAPDSEPALRAELMSATWPADVVNLAADYRRRFPRGPSMADVASRAEGAARARQALESKEVNLSRASVAAAVDTPSLRADAERALLADAGAAVRIAHAYRDGRDGTPPEPLRALQWLHFAAALDGPEANYELSLYYRQQAQMPLAAKYQQRAVDLGFVLPRELDSVRK